MELTLKFISEKINSTQIFQIWENHLKIQKLILKRLNKSTTKVTIQIIRVLMNLILLYSPPNTKYLTYIQNDFPEKQANILDQKTNHKNFNVNKISPSHPFLNRILLLEQANNLLKELFIRLNSTTISHTESIVLVNSLFCILEKRDVYCSSIIQQLINFQVMISERNFQHLQSTFSRKNILNLIKSVFLRILGHKSSYIIPWRSKLFEKLIKLKAKQQAETILSNLEQEIPSISHDFSSLHDNLKKRKVEFDYKFRATSTLQEQAKLLSQTKATVIIDQHKEIFTSFAEQIFAQLSPELIANLVIHNLNNLPSQNKLANDIEKSMKKYSKNFLEKQNNQPLQKADTIYSENPFEALNIHLFKRILSDLNRLKQFGYGDLHSTILSKLVCSIRQNSFKCFGEDEEDEDDESLKEKTEKNSEQKTDGELEAQKNGNLEQKQPEQKLDEKLDQNSKSKKRNQIFQSQFKKRNYYTTLFLNYIFDNFHQKYNLAIQWLFEEFGMEQFDCEEQTILTDINFLQTEQECKIAEIRNPTWKIAEMSISVSEIANTSRYNFVLLSILQEMLMKLTPFDRIFTQFFLDIPFITDQAFDFIMKYFQENSTIDFGLDILKNLLFYRYPYQQRCLEILLKLSTSTSSDIRFRAINLIVNTLYSNNNFSGKINAFATESVGTLLDMEPSKATPEYTKSKMDLFLAICGKDFGLLFKLVELFTTSPTFIRSIIYKNAQNLIRRIMNFHKQQQQKQTAESRNDDPEQTPNQDAVPQPQQSQQDGLQSVSDDEEPAQIIQIIQDCSKSSFKLIFKFLYALSENRKMSARLTKVVRNNYSKFKDPHFLIPILNDLTKEEFLRELNNFISLDLNSLKLGIQRLITVQPSPLSPVELLIALHSLEVNQTSVEKIKEVIRKCLENKIIFTQSVFSRAIQQLVDINPVPRLFMVTLIFAQKAYPKMAEFVSKDILTRLILKNVWEDSELWKGFRICLNMIGGHHASSVLLQLPKSQLSDILKIYPDLKQPLLDFITSTDAFIPREIREVIKFI
eukprot:Anaeramoba_ignava/a90857_65.p1 GENE.a90857_65~~a90857_65.p1  ORF type:complete len:1058 (-),score=329.29 a90857_65:10-3108(-)